MLWFRDNCVLSLPKWQLLLKLFYSLSTPLIFIGLFDSVNSEELHWRGTGHHPEHLVLELLEVHRRHIV